MRRLILLAVATFGVCIATSPPVEEVAEPDCSPPFWHGQLGDNWLLAGISTKTSPKFKLKVAGIGENGAYKTRGSHNIFLKVNRPKKKGAKLIHGFTLDFKAENSSCGSGKFWVRKGGRSTPATAMKGCNFIYLDGNTDLTRTRGIRWKGPKCGCVTIIASIRSSDNMIFYDSDDPEIAEQYKVLRKKVCHPTN